MADNAKQRNWTREETILAFELYCITPQGQDTAANPKLQALAKAIGRTASSVKLKLQNFKSLDSSYTANGRVGLANASETDRTIAAEFMHNWQDLVLEASRLKNRFGLSEDYSFAALAESADIAPEGRDIMREQKIRIGQDFFRNSLLSSYGQCCITGIALPALLRASHIKPWAASDSNEKLSPGNGLLLNALFDAAFDKGYITVRPDYKIALCREILSGKDDAARNVFLPYAGKPIYLPSRFLPDKTFLEYHNKHVFLK